MASLDSSLRETDTTTDKDRLHYETLRLRQLSEMLEQFPGFLRRLKWSPERIREERQRRLRQLIAIAKEKSPWHARRLSNIDAGSFTEEDLVKLPVMTKNDLMTNFDEIITDKRITLSLVNAHVSGLTKDKYLLDSYHVVASGGTSGVRGVYVYNWDEWITSFLSNRISILWMNPILLRLLSFSPIRHVLIRYARSAETKTQLRGGYAYILADIASHMTSAWFQTFQFRPILKLPASRPLREIVAGLNSVRPDILHVYPSMLYQLALEAKAGRLQIKPNRIICGGEPLFPYIRDAVRQLWNVEVTNSWACSEGGRLAWSCGKGKGMHLNEDLHIIEAVDEDGRPAPAGVRASKIYLTNLFNHTQPLIRYEISDQVTFLDDSQCPCGSNFRRVEDIQGRQTDLFSYPGGVVVHPLVFVSIFEHYPNLVEFQVRQLPTGASISLVANGPLELEKLKNDLRENLQKSGLKNPEISANIVDRLQRTSGGAKLKRFIQITQEPSSELLSS